MLGYVVSWVSVGSARWRNRRVVVDAGAVRLVVDVLRLAVTVVSVVTTVVSKAASEAENRVETMAALWVAPTVELKALAMAVSSSAGPRASMYMRQPPSTGPAVAVHLLPSAPVVPPHPPALRRHPIDISGKPILQVGDGGLE